VLSAGGSTSNQPFLPTFSDLHLVLCVPVSSDNLPAR